jgi:hypothetical protein
MRTPRTPVDSFGASTTDIPGKGQGRHVLGGLQVSTGNGIRERPAGFLARAATSHQAEELTGGEGEGDRPEQDAGACRHP